MQITKTLERIHALGMFSHPASLERIRAVLNALGNPERDFPAIHLAGTNGKGSTAAMTASCFRAAGYKTGLFISPYILNFRERIQINGEWIPEETLIRLEQRVHDTALPLTEFEMITAIGFLYFAEQKCEIAVVETGLGGRLDATNTLADVRVSVLTKIGLDHTAVLGDTLTEIATEKCGIIKTGKTVSAVSQPEEAFGVICQFDGKVIVPDLTQLMVLESNVFGNRFFYRNVEYCLPLGGFHQIENALTVLETIRVSGFCVPDEAVQRGLRSVKFPARLEVVRKNPLFVLDGAHNPDGAAVLAETMRAFEGKIVGIFGMMRDKNCRDYAKTVLPLCRHVFTVCPNLSDRAMSAEELAELSRPYCDKVTACDTLEQAVRLAEQAAGEDPVFGFGSLYLAAALHAFL